MSKLDSPMFRRSSDGRKMPNTGGWQTRHREALMLPQGPERPIVRMLSAWAQYADGHKTRYDSGIGEDGVLGPQWAAIGVAVRGLLNGETGRLDCGTLDSFILDTLTAEGFTEEGERV